MIPYERLGLSWLGNATIRVESGETIAYIDPTRSADLDRYDDNEADLVCVSHGHHYDSDAIRAVANGSATVVLFDGIDVHRLGDGMEPPATLPFEIRSVDAESDIAVGDAIVRTTAAYNDPAGPHVRQNGEPYHPEGRGCGFHVTLNGVSVYYPGDTDVLDGHEHLDVDVFCPPIGGVCTMDRHEAADLAEAMAPDLVVPLLYDTFDETEATLEAFAADIESRGLSVALDL